MRRRLLTRGHGVKVASERAWSQRFSCEVWWPRGPHPSLPGAAVPENLEQHGIWKNLGVLGPFVHQAPGSPFPPKSKRVLLMECTFRQEQDRVTRERLAQLEFYSEVEHGRCCPLSLRV